MRPVSVAVVALAAFSLPPHGSAKAQQVLAAVDWADPDLVTARSEGKNLLGSSSGFEAAGGGNASEARLPIRGPLPSTLKAVFDVTKGGFESSKSRPPAINASKIKALLSTSENKLSYAIAYEIRGGLDVYSSATRLTRKGPPGTSTLSSPKCQPTGDNEHDGQYSVICHVAIYGIVYTTILYCSSQKTYPYCKTTDYAEDILNRTQVLFPGVPD